MGVFTNHCHVKLMMFTRSQVHLVANIRMPKENLKLALLNRGYAQGVVSSKKC